MAKPDNLPFDPTLPQAVALPWGGGWAGTEVVYDLYKCEAFLDEQATLMAAHRRARKALEAQSPVINALPDGPDKNAASDAWNDAWGAELRANYLTQIGFFGVSVEYANGTTGKASDPATWRHFPTAFLRWIVNDGWALARAELWGDPKPAGATPSSSPSPSAPPPAAPP